jgi:O-phospho-L-seryl-tRNASec:L-selenocysteinyl-tRNA synthase
LDLDEKLLELLPENMIERGRITLDSFLKPIKDLLHQRKLPDTPLKESQIDILLQLLSSMDTDKDPSAFRVGEREGRVVSSMLERLSGGFNHGIGRSGQLSAPQPKAPGASLMQILADQVALDAIRALGLSNVNGALVTPLSTGMSLALVLSHFKKEFNIDSILFPRIDHKSPKKAIEFVGLNDTPIPTQLVGDAVQLDSEGLEVALKLNNNCGVMITTSFFPPRESDPVKEVAKLCKEFDVPLVVNNAYGLQSEKLTKQIRSGIDAGRVDAIIQSSDKNFLTPVGASIIVSPNQDIIESISSMYPGRASATPVLQTLLALLLLGKSGYQKLRSEQRENHSYLVNRMKEIADKTGQRLLNVDNEVACAMTLDNLDTNVIGAHLYNLRVTGPRTVARGQFGSCIDDYPHDYIVMNAAIGSRKTDVLGATTKLYKELIG